MAGTRAASQWSTAWRRLIEEGGPGGLDPAVVRRLHQGHAYHRAGRVTDLRVSPGRASVRVQGDRATPHSVVLEVRQLDEAGWWRVAGVLAGQVRHTARLLAGHPPESLDAELEGTGVQVFLSTEEVAASCDCADTVWPCAHVAALWETLAEALEEDPFVLLRLRGRGRERLLGELAQARRRRTGGAAVEGAGVPVATLDAGHWTSARTSLDGLSIPAPTPPRAPAGTLRVMGDPPGWAGGVDAWKLFSPLVKDAADWLTSVDERA